MSRLALPVAFSVIAWYVVFHLYGIVLEALHSIGV